MGRGMRTRIEVVNDRVRRVEVWEALHKAKNNKATEPDGIPMDFIKGSLEEERTVLLARDKGGPTPETPMTECIVIF